MLLVVLALGAAALYVARGTWRAWAGGKRGCGGSCGCAKPAVPPERIRIAAEELLSRFQRQAPGEGGKPGESG
jgi:hypothetical protein